MDIAYVFILFLSYRTEMKNELQVTYYLNDKGEGTREEKAEKQLFSTFVLSFYVIQQLSCFCLIQLPHFIQLCS